MIEFGRSAKSQKTPEKNEHVETSCTSPSPAQSNQRAVQVDRELGVCQTKTRTGRNLTGRKQMTATSVERSEYHRGRQPLQTAPWIERRFTVVTRGNHALAAFGVCIR